MFQINNDKMSEEFFKSWQAAGIHLNTCISGGIPFWLRAHPYPPFLEHLSFCIGNQLFFIRIEDKDRKVQGPGTLQGLMYIAEKCNGYACILKMAKDYSTGAWLPSEEGWGLVDTKTGNRINPIALITKEKIEMTYWELQDMAVQIIRDYLKEKGFQLMSWQSNPEIDPAIWFIGESKGPEWVVVRVVQYPVADAPRPDNWHSIYERCSKMSSIGHFASVALANGTQLKEEGIIPLWRGEGVVVRFNGLT